ncbi:MAG: PP0621 family protein [Pseudomonadota bacterium]
MVKLLLLAAGVWLIYVILKRYGRSIRQEKPPAAEGGEDMVRCSQCGVHLPKSESILSHGKHYCSDEHRRLNQRQ